MTPPLQEIISLNPNKNSIKTRFTYRFLRALKQLNSKNGSATITPPSRLDQIHQRSIRVKLAANESMAAAVGSKRAWSRAILRKIRNRQKIRRHHALKRKKMIIINGINPKRNSSFGEAKQLRKLVPGGEGMEIGSLLEETAHYIKCLTTQVQVMENILHFHSP